MRVGAARTVVTVVWVLTLCLPLAGVATLALLPLWSWLEATAGIESIGHSGPAAWCYQTVYAACVLLVASTMIWRRRRAKPAAQHDLVPD